MTDVDTIRWMASEHDLEFVDLDNYGVDPAAGEILPVELARRHHMVAIKRKFGTPVIATSDPDDLLAQDSVRASIGRDFISVVASPEQIDSYIDRLFGPALTAAAPPTEDPSALGERLPEGDQITEWTDEDSAGVADEAAAFGETGPAPPPDQAPPVDPVSTDGDSFEHPVEDTSDVTVETDPDETPGSVGGRGRRAKEERKRKKSAAEPQIASEQAEAVVDTGGAAQPGVWQDVVVDEPGLQPSLDAAGRPWDEPAHEGSEGAVDGFVQPSASFPALADPTEPSMDAVEAFDFQSLEPATSLLPGFGSERIDPGTGVDSGPLALTPSVDQLAELARSLQAPAPPESGDEAVIAADLVDEAVATYQEQLGDDQRTEADEFEAPSGTAMFPPLAKALVDGERVSLGDMEGVLDEHYETGQSIARILTAQKLVTEADLMWGMAQEMGLEFVDLDTVGIDLAEAGTIPEATARHHNVIVIANDNGTPVVAASNPTDVFAMDDLRTIMGRNFIVVVATRSQISAYIGRAFNSGGDAADMAMEASLEIEHTDNGPVDDIQAVTEEAPIVRYVNLLILQALNERASDIHIEPTATELRIRYRIDGVLHDVSTAPRTIAPAVTTRLKVMADMNIAEHRVPQDGRISLNVGAKGIDLRMATLPTIYGEKIVMRVLDKSSVVLGFADLGFDEDLLRTYEGLYTKPYGTILVTGPTGSGKSTTLYTTLSALNSPEKNIITVEDPVELPLKGVNQVQLNVKAGLNFAAALRAILRSDPDVVLVGEIRDKETAVISIEAALTGHMVLSTLHTNSAASTPMRLIEMGLEPFLVTSAVSGVLAQRLARRLCVHCKDAFEPTEADIISAGWNMEEVEAVGGMDKVYRAVGCSACSNTGYRGRKALAELLPMTEEIERIIIEGGSVEEIHRVGVAQGMCTLRQSGLRKAIEGETTLEEVLRVVA
jgi:type IV pilus assembly protein PilB